MQMSADKSLICASFQIFTYYTAYQLFKHSTASRGSKRLTKYIGQSGTSSDVRVNYCPDVRLDAFYEAAQENADGVLAEEEIEGLVAAVKEPELLQSLRELRLRHIRQHLTKTGSLSNGGYALLR